MTWWCVARGTPWDWTWQPYAGAWIFVAAVAVAYATAVRRAGVPIVRSRAALFAAGLFALWAASDWPLAALGAGYLVSAHTLQYLLYVMVAPPLLLLAVPAAAWATILRGRRGTMVAAATRPLTALLLFTTVVVLTHLPALVDTLMRMQLGSFAIDMVWFAAGLVVWWPAVQPDPHGRKLSPPLRIGYLFVLSVIPGGPAVFMTFAEFPIYELYELAPRVTALSATRDQQLGGLLMKIAGFLIALTWMSAIFFRWQRAEREDDPSLRLPAPRR